MAQILIVDDEKMICEEFSDILREDGHEVQTAFNGLEALDKIQGKVFDLVFLDVLMPRMEGGEVFRKIKDIKPDLPIAIMSGYIPQHKEKEVLQQGATACLKKPLDLGKVREIIESIAPRSA